MLPALMQLSDPGIKHGNAKAGPQDRAEPAIAAQIDCGQCVTTIRVAILPAFAWRQRHHGCNPVTEFSVQVYQQVRRKEND